MKNILQTFILLSCVLSASSGAFAANRLYIVPADADGNIVRDGSGYIGQKEMIQDPGDENKYTVGNVKSDSGIFAIYAMNEDNGLSTFYAPVTWAVTPLPVNYPSPLAIARDGETVRLPATGTYDFEFYDRDIQHITYHMLVPKPVSVDIDVKYPSQLFLVTSDNSNVTLEGDPVTGIYQGNAIVPEDFKISYEPRFDLDVFIFGPASGTADKVIWHDNEKIPIAYAKGTEAVFESGNMGRTSEYSTVSVNLAEGYFAINEAVVVGVDEIFNDSAPARYYTLSGVRLTSKPDSGYYIRVESGRASKHLAR